MRLTACARAEPGGVVLRAAPAPGSSAPLLQASLLQAPESRDSSHSSHLATNQDFCSNAFKLSKKPKPLGSTSWFLPASAPTQQQHTHAHNTHNDHTHHRRCYSPNDRETNRAHPHPQTPHKPQPHSAPPPDHPPQSCATTNTGSSHIIRRRRGNGSLSSRQTTSTTDPSVGMRPCYTRRSSRTTTTTTCQHPPPSRRTRQTTRGSTPPRRCAPSSVSESTRSGTSTSASSPRNCRVSLTNHVYAMMPSASALLLCRARTLAACTLTPPPPPVCADQFRSFAKFNEDYISRQLREGELSYCS